MDAYRVLILEDDAVIASLLAELLGSMGHWVCGVEPTEAGGIAAARRYRPELIIADIWLREGNGVSAITKILDFCLVPHILVSADVRGLEVRVPNATILQKPFLGISLASAIVHAFDATAAPRPTSSPH